MGEFYHAYVLLNLVRQQDDHSCLGRLLEANGVSMQNDLSGILLNTGNFRKYWNAFSDVTDVSPQFAKDPCITLKFTNEVLAMCSNLSRVCAVVSCI